MSPATMKTAASAKLATAWKAWAESDPGTGSAMPTNIHSTENTAAVIASQRQSRTRASA
jgi:hypothetical protein